jgi:hypothetical protein
MTSMKSAVVLALIGALVAPSMSLAAQDSSSTPQHYRPATRSWPVIRSWEPGVEVTMWMPGSELHRRYFITADDAAITLLNVSDAKLPSGVARLLLRKSVEHAEYFPVPDGTTFKLDDRVTLTTSGLFVADQKVAEYSQVVERFARTDVENGTVSVDNAPVKRGMATSSCSIWRHCVSQTRASALDSKTPNARSRCSAAISSPNLELAGTGPVGATTATRSR